MFPESLWIGTALSELVQTVEPSRTFDPFPVCRQQNHGPVLTGEPRTMSLLNPLRRILCTRPQVLALTRFSSSYVSRMRSGTQTLIDRVTRLVD